MENRICVVCGNEFTPRVVQQLCCCKECSKIHQRQSQYKRQKELWKRKHKLCKLCGKPFMPAIDAPKNFCSKECAAAGKRYQHACYMYSVGRRKSEPNINDYKPGGEKFLQTIYREHKETKERKRNTVSKICPVCGETFETNLPSKYCSPECKRAMNKYKNMCNMWRKGIAKNQPIFDDYKKGGRLYSRTRSRENEKTQDSLIAIDENLEQSRIGNLIKENRLEKKLTQSKLAESLNVNKHVIYKYEKGLIKTIPFEKRVKLALTLNIDIIDLLYSTEDDLKLCIARSKKSCQ